MPQSAIRSLSSRSKYLLSVNHFRPSASFKFPSRFLDGCQRSCQLSYLLNNPWFVYSKSEDGLFCLPCVLFANKGNLGQFVTHKFNHWTKKTSKFLIHNSTKFHQLCITQAEALKSVQLNPASSIDCRLNSVRVEEIARNRSIIKNIVDAVHFCGKQGVALRGHRDDATADPSGNKGTLLSLLDYSIQSGNSVLAKHFEVASKNATYTSKTTQNEIIGIIGDYIREKFIDEIKIAKFFSILCDDVTDVSNKEQVSIVLRFVDATDTIREEFMDFITTDRITGEALAIRIKECLARYKLDLLSRLVEGKDMTVRQICLLLVVSRDCCWLRIARLCIFIVNPTF